MSTEHNARYISVGSIKEHIQKMHPDIPPIQGSGMTVFDARYAAHAEAHQGVAAGEPLHTHTKETQGKAK